MVKEMGEWLMVQGPGIESQWETVALYWCQSVCLCGLPSAVQQHGVRGEAGHGETQAVSKFRAAATGEAAVKIQRSEEASHVHSQVNAFQVQRAAQALRREYVRCIKRKARKRLYLR